MVWGPWLIARCWLALRGRLPWKLMAFLNDAHTRGVFRKSGGFYQFRHARLQQYLTALGPSQGASLSHAPTESTAEHRP